MSTVTATSIVNLGGLGPELSKQLALVSQNCTQCQICVNECNFLVSYGDPKTLADSYDPTSKRAHRIPFECSLCELCTAVCPHGVNPVGMFLEMRREAFAHGEALFPEHRRLRKYEKTGASKRYSWYALPQGCDTIFFPGCALTGSRSQTTLQVYQHLQQEIPTIGIVLDCCTKPSHDLGDSHFFNTMFGEMKNYLLKHGIKTVVVGCPNCQKIFSEYGLEFTTTTVYELLNTMPLPATPQTNGTVCIHDPCVSRFYAETQDSIRSLLHRKGLEINEPAHTRQRTLCCGEGGGVKSLSPGKAAKWENKRLIEANGERIVSYCAACTATFSSRTRSSHILDLLFEPEQALSNKASMAKAPLTYFNRLKLKSYLRRHMTENAVSRERTFYVSDGQQRDNKILSLPRLLIFCSFLMAAFIFISQAWKT